MTHEKVLGTELTRKIQRANLAQLRMMLIMILVMMSKRGHLSKSQRRSLAITETKLGIRGALKREKAEMGGKRSKGVGGKGKKHSKKMSPALKRFLKKHHRFPKKGELR